MSGSQPASAEPTEAERRVPCGSLVLDERRLIVRADDGFCDAFACSPEDVLGSVFDDLVHTRNHRGRSAYFRSVNGPNIGPSEVILNLCIGDRTHHVRLHMWQRNAGPWIVRVERIDGTPLELALDRQRHCAAVIRDSADGIALCDSDGVIVEYNPQFVELVRPGTAPGVHKLDVSGQQLLAFASGVLHARLSSALAAPVTEERQFVGDLDHCGAHLSVRLSPAHDAMGRYLGSILVLRDVTAQEQEKRLSAAVRHANESIVITDANGIIQYVNPAFERVTGYSAEEAVGQHTRMMNSGIQSAEFYAALWSTIKAGQVWSGRFSNKKKDGGIIVQDATISPILDECGVVMNFVAVNKDVTEQIALETRARQGQKLEAIGQLAAGIAHEINTPVQFVSDNTDFLRRAFSGLVTALGACDRLLAAAKQEGVCSEAVAETEAALKKAKVKFLAQQVPSAIDQSLEGLTRVAGIVAAMKEFSHPSQGVKQAVDLRAAIETTVTVARNEWKYVAEVVTNFDPALPAVPCLRDEMSQVVLNIIVNAAHSISDVTDGGREGKGTITISTTRDGEWAELRISDTGTGIPATVLDKIFDPFFTTKDVGKGTGQGLAIAHSIVVDKHGGTIEILSEVGKGATFVVRLPLRVDQAPSEGRAA